jgi:hypothetical protein
MVEGKARRAAATTRAIAILAACAAATVEGRGQVGITISGEGDAAITLHSGEPAAFEIVAAPNAPFAVLASPVKIAHPTLFGLLEAHPLVPEATIVFDGFDPTHYSFAFAKADATGAFSTTVTPFHQSVAGPPIYHVQALSYDPTAPLSLRLSNHLELQYSPPEPVVLSIAPNVAAPGDLVTIHGDNFVADPQAISASIGGVPMLVAAANASTIWAFVPIGASSGEVVVSHLGGSSLGDQQMTTWLVVVAGTPVGPPETIATLPSVQSAIGSLTPGGSAVYSVALAPGRQLVAELYPYNTATGRVEYPQPAVGVPYPDPVIDVQIDVGSPVTLFTEDDSGPATCAAVGPASNGAFFVAEYAQTYLVRVRFKNPLASGTYYVVFGSDQSATLPLTVQRVVPEIANDGELVMVQGTGFDATNPAANVVLLKDGAVAVVAATSSTLHFVAPPNYGSGPVGVATTTGTVSPNWERVDTWLARKKGGVQFVAETESPLLMLPATALAKIDGVGDLDDFVVALAEGQQLSVECFACDPGYVDILNSTSFLSPIVDPEIRILPVGASLPIYAWDMNSGPGVNALMGGGSTTPAFVAPQDGLYRIRVSASFWLSWGEYYLIASLGP